MRLMFSVCASIFLATAMSSYAAEEKVDLDLIGGFNYEVQRI